MKKSICRRVLVDSCKNCGSIWLDRGELEEISGANSKKTVKKLHKKAKKEYTEENSQVYYKSFCFKCKKGQLYPKKLYGLDLDICDSCGGIFFDSGELQDCIQGMEEKKQKVKYFWQKLLSLFSS